MQYDTIAELYPVKHSRAANELLDHGYLLLDMETVSYVQVVDGRPLSMRGLRYIMGRPKGVEVYHLEPFVLEASHE